MEVSTSEPGRSRPGTPNRRGGVARDFGLAVLIGRLHGWSAGGLWPPPYKIIPNRRGSVVAFTPCRVVRVAVQQGRLT